MSLKISLAVILLHTQAKSFFKVEFFFCAKLHRTVRECEGDVSLDPRNVIKPLFTSKRVHIHLYTVVSLFELQLWPLSSPKLEAMLPSSWLCLCTRGLKYRLRNKRQSVHFVLNDSQAFVLSKNRWKRKLFQTFRKRKERKHETNWNFSLMQRTWANFHRLTFKLWLKRVSDLMELLNNTEWLE